MSHYDYSGQVVIVTGAGSGIGRASAKLFAAAGAIVLVNDVDADSAEQVVAEIAANGGIASVAVADVTDRQQVAGLVSKACTDHGRLDVMFNNAGGARPAPLLDASEEQFQHIMALNFDSLYYGVVEALPVMLEQGHGTLLATSSGAGLGAVDGLAIYGAAKAAVIGFIRAVASEFGQRGIRANVISPGPMATPGLLGWADTLPGGAQGYAARQPSGRLGTAEDIAEAALFLASDAAGYINGAVLPVDGAIHAILATPQ